MKTFGTKGDSGLPYTNINETGKNGTCLFGRCFVASVAAVVLVLCLFWMFVSVQVDTNKRSVVFVFVGHTEMTVSERMIFYNETDDDAGKESAEANKVQENCPPPPQCPSVQEPQPCQDGNCAGRPGDVLSLPPLQSDAIGDTEDDAAMLTAEADMDQALAKINAILEALEDVAKGNDTEDKTDFGAIDQFPEKETPKTVTVNLYSDANLLGTKFVVTLEGDKCFDLPKDFDDVTSSVDTNGNSARLYADHGCSGKFFEINRVTYESLWLGSAKFNDQVSSLRSC